MQLSLGNLLINAVENDLIRRLPSASYNTLANPTLKILVLSLQKERIHAYLRYKQGGELKTCFTYNSLLKLVFTGAVF